MSEHWRIFRELSQAAKTDANGTATGAGDASGIADDGAPPEAGASSARGAAADGQAAASKPNKMKLLSQRFRRPMGTKEPAASKTKAKKNTAPAAFSEV